jgi:putative heme-binding domain-containing protein
MHQCCKWLRPIGISAFLLATPSTSAQDAPPQGYPAAEVSAGARLYRTHCVSCHGIGGDQLPAVHLLRGKFVSPNLSNDDIIDVIMNGTPNGMMSATNLSRLESSHIVAYLRSEALGGAASVQANKAVNRGADSRLPIAGNATRGEIVFEKSDCSSCHRVGDKGGYSGPPLSDIAFVRTPEELRRSVLDPDAEILPHNRSYRAVTSEGATVTGRLLNHDTFKVQLVDSNGRLLSFTKANLRTHGFVTRSPMPSYQGRLSADELTDLIAYLATLKEQ